MKAFSLSYFLRKATGKNSDHFKLFGRISVQGKRTDFTLNRKINSSDWDERSGKPKGRSPSSRELEKYLATMEEKFYAIERLLIEKSIPVSSESLLKQFNVEVKGIDAEERKTLFQLFTKHNTQLAELFEKGLVVRPTLTRYTTTKNYLADFIKEKTGKNDAYLSELSYSFILDFDHWLRIKKNCAHNTAIKYIKNIKKVIKLGIDYNWLDKDPFYAFKITTKPVRRYSLDMTEIKKIEDLKITIPRLNRVRDYFLFSCLTGLSYIDLTTLTQNDINYDNEGEKWIIKERKKTKVVSSIYLLPKALEILNTYSNDPMAIKNGTIFPPITNQKLNSYLKEIADLTGIAKSITFHVARHTFSTTVTLGNGVSLETISSQLGHTNIRQTQHYARMVNQRIKKEMHTIKELYS